MRTRGRDKSRETEDYQISHWCKRMKTTWRNQEKAKGKMEEKKYLKWYNKVGYGSGDMAGNVVYSFLSSFIMIYLTNIVGLNAGIVGTLIAVSKLFDGVTDIFFGAMIDKTKSRLGKARPWMLYAYIGCAVTLVANFAIPTNMGKFAQYAWFFIAYTLLNAVFFTANNIAYAALVALVTKNSKERVEMGSWRFIFTFSTVLIIQSVTVKFVQILGGGAYAWKVVAIVFAIVGVIVNTISVFSVKELPEEELNGDGVVDDEIEKYEKEFRTEEFRNIEADVVYKVKNKNVFILIEHQSSLDLKMAYRILRYKNAIIESAINKRKLKEKNYKIPKVIPIVLYTGKRKWQKKKPYMYAVIADRIHRNGWVNVRRVENGIRMLKKSYGKNPLTAVRCRALKHRSPSHWHLAI